MNNNYIEELVIDAKKGNNKAILNLIEEFNPLIFGLIRKTYIAGYEVEDLKNECYIILIKCIKLYNPEKHRFTAYATNAIKNGFYYLIRSSKSKRFIQIGDSLTSSGNLSDYQLSSNSNTEDNYINKCQYDVLYQAILELSPDEKQFIYKIFFEDISLKDYARGNNLSYSSVIRKKYAILKKLKKLIDNF